MRSSCILVTGGLGYIGSHTIVELLQSSNNSTVEVIALDNLCNTSIDVLDAIKETLDDDDTFQRLSFVNQDVKDIDALRALFKKRSLQGSPIVAVIHFAALKSVGDSLSMPLQYYQENVVGLLTLLQVMQEWQCRSIIFSSSATVYGSQSREDEQCTETLCTHRADDNAETKGMQGCVGLANPYGRTKWMCEAILHDACVADCELQAIALRYFNPVGAHEGGFLREQPKGTPTNLMPCVVAAIKANEPVKIFGKDYNTLDGSAVRDYIHVVDLAKGHIAALNKILQQQKKSPVQTFRWLSTDLSYFATTHETHSSEDGMQSDSDEDNASSDGYSSASTNASVDTPLTSQSSYFSRTDCLSPPKTNALQVYNLGTGQGASVMQVLIAMRKASGRAIPSVDMPRRQGDIAFSVANPSKAKSELQWQANLTLEDACRSVCRQFKE